MSLAAFLGDKDKETLTLERPNRSRESQHRAKGLANKKASRLLLLRSISLVFYTGLKARRIGKGEVGEVRTCLGFQGPKKN